MNIKQWVERTLKTMGKHQQELSCRLLVVSKFEKVYLEPGFEGINCGCLTNYKRKKIAKAVRGLSSRSLRQEVTSVMKVDMLGAISAGCLAISLQTDPCRRVAGYN